jgi:hypothetical protein
MSRVSPSDQIVSNDSLQLPPGYTMQEAANGTKFAVPKFLIPSTRHSFDTEEKKREIHIDDNAEVIFFLILLIFDCHVYFRRLFADVDSLTNLTVYRQRFFTLVL